MTNMYQPFFFVLFSQQFVKTVFYLLRLFPCSLTFKLTEFVCCGLPCSVSVVWSVICNKPAKFRAHDAVPTTDSDV